MYSSHNEPDISSSIACFVDDIKRRQLSQLQPKVPDTCHNMWKSRDVSGKFWTIANEGVPRRWLNAQQHYRPTHICAVVAYSRMILHSLRVNLLHIVHRSSRSGPVVPLLFFSDIVFTELTSDLIFDFFRIVSGCSQICSGFSSTICTLLVTALSRG